VSENKVERFALGVVIDGKTYCPPGWIWLLAIALATGNEKTGEEAKEAYRRWQSDYYEI